MNTLGKTLMENDSKDIFFMLQVDGDCAHSKGNSNKCSSVALMFQIGRLYGGSPINNGEGYGSFSLVTLPSPSPSLFAPVL